MAGGRCALRQMKASGIDDLFLMHFALFFQLNG
jgi:hypothetical protein